MNIEYDQYIELLKSLASIDQVGEASKQVNLFIQQNPIKVISFSCQVCKSYVGDVRITMDALNAIALSLRWPNMVQYNIIQRRWKSLEEEFRHNVKSTLLDAINCTDERVQNLAARCISYIFRLELEQWADLIPTIITKITSTTSSNYKNGAICIIYEIYLVNTFQDRNIPYERLPQKFPDLFHYLITQLNSLDNVPCLIKSSLVLTEMVSKTPTIVQTDQEVKLVVDAIFHPMPIAFANKNIMLTNSLHSLLLHLAFANYNKIGFLMQPMVTLTINDIKSAKILAVQGFKFWNDFIRRCQSSKLDDKTRERYYEAISTAKDKILEPALFCLITDSSAPVSPESSSEDLTIICKSLIKKLSHIVDIYERTTKFVDDMLSSKNTCNHNAAILAIHAISTKRRWDKVKQYLPIIFEDARSAPSIRLHQSILMLLIKFLKVSKGHMENYLQILIDIAGSHMSSDDCELQIVSFKLIMLMIKECSPLEISKRFSLF